MQYGMRLCLQERVHWMRMRQLATQLLPTPSTRLICDPSKGGGGSSLLKRNSKQEPSCPGMRGGMRDPASHLPLGMRL